MNNPYVTCYDCSGYGLQDGIDGPVYCWTCKGDCVIRDRDDKGRFITHPYTMYHIGDGIYSITPPDQNKTSEDEKYDE